jgi:hypothetical protein
VFAVEVPKLKEKLVMDAKVGIEVAIGGKSFKSPLVDVKGGNCQWMHVMEDTVNLPINFDEAPDTFIYLTTYECFPPWLIIVICAYH